MWRCSGHLFFNLLYITCDNSVNIHIYAHMRRAHKAKRSRMEIKMTGWCVCVRTHTHVFWIYGLKDLGGRLHYSRYWMWQHLLGFERTPEAREARRCSWRRRYLIVLLPTVIEAPAFKRQLRSLASLFMRPGLLLVFLVKSYGLVYTWWWRDVMVFTMLPFLPSTRQWYDNAETAYSDFPTLASVVFGPRLCFLSVLLCRLKK